MDAESVIDAQLGQLNHQLANFLKADVILLKAPMVQPVDDNVRAAIEEVNGADSERLIVLVETIGGHIETVERIVGVFRKHYPEVEFIVPNFAYSAGTVLVLSGDEIYMDYHSVLGPIDPQYQEGGVLVPGIGYLAKYDELLSEINDPTKSIDQVRAQMTYLVQKFEPARLYHIEQAVKHSKELLKNWLPRYKFKDWTQRETSKEPVTDAYKELRANQIAECLGDPEEWHSHGRGIGMSELTSEKIKLKIKDFGENPELNKRVRPYYNLAVDYMRKRAWGVAIHTKHGFRGVSP